MMQDEGNVRITSEIWVAAYRKNLDKKGIPIFINRTGNKIAGAILVKVSKMDGMATLYHRVLDKGGGKCWMKFHDGSEEKINFIIEKQNAFDPDLWVLEIEDPKGRHYLDAIPL